MSVEVGYDRGFDGAEGTMLMTAGGIIGACQCGCCTTCLVIKVAIIVLIVAAITNRPLDPDASYKLLGMGATFIGLMTVVGCALGCCVNGLTPSWIERPRRY